MATKITREVLVGYLNCKTKAHLKLVGEHGNNSDYEKLIAAFRNEVKQEAIAKILARQPETEIVRNIPVTATALRAGSSFVLDATLDDDRLSIEFDGLMRVDGPSTLGDFHYAPMLFQDGRKVSKEQRLLLELYGLLLFKVQGRMPVFGMAWHGPNCDCTKLRLSPDLRRAERLLQSVKEMGRAESSPMLILNSHCSICEFHQRCHDQAVREENLSLLRGIGEKEIKGYIRKGIFTITQLAHTFRPRRRGRRTEKKGCRRYHALHALAIRDKRIYVFGTPQCPTAPVSIYLDLEGKPEDGFIYLVGLVIVQNGLEERCSFWAETPVQESMIFDQLLDVVERFEDFVVYAYGSYERSFLKRLGKRSDRKELVGKLLKSLVNTLTLVYSNLYFPCYTNSLKEIGRCLGFSWSGDQLTGIQSIATRTMWEVTHDAELKQRLMTYNLEDCLALKRVTEFIHAVAAWATSGVGRPWEETGSPHVALVHELDKAANISKWGKTTFVHPEFNYINDCAYFDYQRERVFVRTSRQIRRRKTLRRGIHHNRKLRKSKDYIIVETVCPTCSSSDVEATMKPMSSNFKGTRSKRAFDLLVTAGGVRRKVIECRSPAHRCLTCGHQFIPASYQNLDKHFHGLKSWAIYLHVAHQISFGTLSELLGEMFSLKVSDTEILMFKSLLARMYQETCRGLMERILGGQVAHADETEVKLKTNKGFVWVFSSLEEVVYMYRPTREGAFLQTMLRDFNGVLVSDFYAAYDGVECAQQKCLIHLIRDINQDIVSNPFDEELRSITQPFGVLLQTIVQAVDLHGLKKRHLKGYEKGVAQFFRHLAETPFTSEVAESLRDRLLRYREKLFTFIQYDGVPWNNNNAENAIKRFAYYREGTVGVLTEAGLNDYLTLLSVYQSCRYKGVSFMKFLLSREPNLENFCAKKRGARLRPLIEVYPNDYFPPHFAHKRRKTRIPR
jgi:predicted RecB family nuclease